MIRKALALAAALSLGVSPAIAGPIAEVCVTPIVTTANGYGTNYVVGGLLTFPGAFLPQGGGAIQSVYVDTPKAQNGGFTFTPLASCTTATTWTDAAAASINAADVNLPRGAIVLSGSSVLGTHGAASAVMIGQVVNTGANLCGILTTNATLTNQFVAATDLKICVDTMQFP